MTLRTPRDLDALNRVLLELFGPSGPLKSFSVYFVDETKRNGFCILEMASPTPRSESISCLEFSMAEMIENAEEAKNEH